MKENGSTEQNMVMGCGLASNKISMLENGKMGSPMDKVFIHGWMVIVTRVSSVNVWSKDMEAKNLEMEIFTRDTIAMENRMVKENINGWMGLLLKELLKMDSGAEKANIFVPNISTRVPTWMTENLDMVNSYTQMEEYIEEISLTIWNKERGFYINKMDLWFNKNG